MVKAHKDYGKSALHLKMENSRYTIFGFSNAIGGLQADRAISGCISFGKVSFGRP